MTPEYPVFSRFLPLLEGATVLDYIPPMRREALDCYAHRMAAHIPNDSILVGVSFGGILAQEIARIIRPRGCVAISSIRSPRQLPPWFRTGTCLGHGACEGMLSGIGHSAGFVPKAIRTASTVRVNKLAGASGRWHRWATAAVLNWRPTAQDFPCETIFVHGDADTTFPRRYVTPDIVVAGGKHALPMSHPHETASVILDVKSSVG